MLDFWEDRYRHPTYAYGTRPNHFFQTMLDRLPAGRALLLAEGEGRNAVYAAQQGWQVTAVDFSKEASDKASELARLRNVEIDYVVASLEDFVPAHTEYDLIALIFSHLPPPTRQMIHRRAVDWLRPSGLIVLEGFHKNQLGKPSGGPKDISLLYAAADLSLDFQALDILTLAEETVHLDEGPHHQGEASVIRLTARKPIAS